LGEIVIDSHDLVPYKSASGANNYGCMVYQSLLGIHGAHPACQ
jgi:hypothetical protein